MLRKFNKSTDNDLLIAGEVEAYTNSYPGSDVPLDLVTNRFQSIQRNRVRCVVLDEDGPKGYVIANRHTVRNRFEIYVESIYIDPTLRGQGKVDLLLNSLIEQSAENIISLDVSVANSSAVDSYQALGFEIQRYRMIKSFPAITGAKR